MQMYLLPASEFIHKQLIKGGKIPSETAFFDADVDVSNIDEGMYYGGFTYVRLGVLELAYELVHLSSGRRESKHPCLDSQGGVGV